MQPITHIDGFRNGRYVGLLAGLVCLSLTALTLSQAALPLTPAAAGSAQVSASISGPVLHYQGRLLDASNNPKPDGSYSIIFSIYNVPTGGAALWTENKSVQTTGGLFTALLGETSALNPSNFNGQSLWLGVEVGADPELQPRQRIAAIAYAMYANTAGNAETLGGQPAGAFAPSAHDHFGQTWSGSASFGISVTNASASGIGVIGVGNYRGVLGISPNNFGVRGESTNYDGVDGFTTGTNVGGVHGRNDTASGFGLNGYSANGIGAKGETINGKGVYGVANGSGYAGYFDGSVHINGTLSKSAGSFKIDDPLDPAHKTLSHSFVESPDMMNIYNGNVTTDAGGDAVVQLPPYFEALNKDFRYQLTVIGTFAQAIVSEEIQSNQFRVKTDKPFVKVSWQVTGVRHDAYANAHRIPVEADKPLAEQGSYLNPTEVSGTPGAAGKP